MATAGLDLTEQKASAKAWWILFAMGFGALIAQMFSTVINPALPQIQQDLSLSLSDTTWIVTSYSLAFGAALVAGGRMGDLVGEVKMIIIGFIIFIGGLVLSAIAINGELLIAGRSIQGIGIGLSAPATLSIVVNSFPLLKRGFAVGTWGFAHGLGLFVGPILGGFLTEYVSWRWVFWIAVPLTVIVIVVTLVATRGYVSHLASGKYDWIGLVFGAVAITAITVGLQNSSAGWDKPLTWGAILAGVILGVAFGVIETKVKDPLVDFSLWKERLFSGGFFTECAVGFVYIPMLTFVGSIFFVSVLGYTPVKAGWVIAITTLVCMVLEPPAGWVVDRIGPGIPIAAALLMQGIALFWLGTMSPEASFGTLLLPLALMGAGVGIALPACNTAGMLAVDKKRAGMGSGLMQMTFNIPAALGTALVTSLIGTLMAGSIHAAASGHPWAGQAQAYATLVRDGDLAAANQMLNGLSPQVADAIRDATINAQASSINMGMIALGVVAILAAVFALIVIGRRRTPDHIPAEELAPVV